MSNLPLRRAAQPQPDHAAFIRAHTRLQAVLFVPEVRLHLAADVMALWELTEADLGRVNLPPPFWAFAWAGGQALGRYVLDDPAWVAGRSVLDFASGSGLCAVAATKAGAASVQAVDIDAYATAAARLNAAANGVTIDALQADIVGRPGRWDVILAGDISYQKDVAERVHGWLAEEATRGAIILIGDPGRAYLPKGLRTLAAYEVPVLPSLEDVTVKRTSVLTIEV